MKKKYRLKLRQCMAGILSLILAAGAVLPSAVSIRADDDSSSSKEYTFYNIASAAAAYYESSQDPTNPDGIKEFGEDAAVTVGNVGGMAGYYDKDISQESGASFGVFRTDIANNEQSMSYGRSGRDSESDEQTKAGNLTAMRDYLAYGAALSKLGLDSTKSDDWFMNGITKFGTFLMKMAVTFNTVSARIMDFVLEVLIMLNPFQFLGDRSFDNGALMNSAEFISDQREQRDAFSEFMDAVKLPLVKLYNQLYAIGWVVTIPLMIAIAIAMAFFWANGKKGILLIVRRILIIALAVPIIGTLYTAALNGLKASGLNGSEYSNQIVGSIYLDFEKWVNTYNLGLPSDVKLYVTNSEDRAKGEIGAEFNYPMRTVIRKLNRLSSLSDTDLWNSDKSKNQDDAFNTSVLDRFMNQATVTADGYETWYRDTNLSKDMLEFISGKTSVSEFQEKNLFTTGNTESAEMNRVASKLLQNGTMECSDTTTIDKEELVGPQQPVKIGAYRVYTSGRKGLSTLGMYNYLATEFDNDAANVMSTKRSANSKVTINHQSVILYGGMMYWLKSLLMILMMAVLSVFMVVAILKYSFHGFFAALSDVFIMTTTGSYKAMAHLITTLASVILGWLGTTLVYEIGQQLIIALDRALTDLLIGFGLDEEWASLIIIAILVLVIWVLIKSVTSMVKAASEYIRSGLNRLAEAFGGHDTASAPVPAVSGADGSSSGSGGSTSVPGESGSDNGPGGLAADSLADDGPASGNPNDAVSKSAHAIGSKSDSAGSTSPAPSAPPSGSAAAFAGGAGKAENAETVSGTAHEATMRSASGTTQTAGKNSAQTTSASAALSASETQSSSASQAEQTLETVKPAQTSPQTSAPASGTESAGSSASQSAQTDRQNKAAPKPVSGQPERQTASRSGSAAVTAAGSQGAPADVSQDLPEQPAQSQTSSASAAASPVSRTPGYRPIPRRSALSSAPSASVSQQKAASAPGVSNAQGQLIQGQLIQGQTTAPSAGSQAQTSAQTAAGSVVSAPASATSTAVRAGSASRVAGIRALDTKIQNAQNQMQDSIENALLQAGGLHPTANRSATSKSSPVTGSKKAGSWIDDLREQVSDSIENHMLRAGGEPETANRSRKRNRKK